MEKNGYTAKSKWSVDHAHCDIGFNVQHLTIGHVRGAFKIFDSNIYTTGKDFLTSEVDLWIDASSITTGDAIRDKHLKSSDFLDVKNFRQITFTSSTIFKSDTKKNHELWGELTLKGVTQMVKFNVQFGGLLNDHQGNARAGFTIEGSINRSDWGLQWNLQTESGDLMVSDEVIVSCEVEFTSKGNNCLTWQPEETFEEIYCIQ